MARLSSLLLSALGLLTLVHAQGGSPLQSLPKCAINCATPLLAQSDCGSTDGNCICTDGPLLDKLSCCLLEKCSEAEVQQAVTAAGTLCRTIFNAPNVPTMAVCPSLSSSTASGASMTSTAAAASSSSSPTGAAAHLVPGAGVVGAVVGGLAVML